MTRLMRQSARTTQRMAIALAFLLAGPAAVHGQEAPLVDAVKKGDVASVRALLQRRANVNAVEPDGSTALHWSAHFDNTALAGLLLKAGADVNAANRYAVVPLSLAAVNGSAAMTELLLKHGANPNAARLEGETVLMTAARTGSAETVKALLAHGADVKARESWKGQDALAWAAGEGHKAVVEALIDHGADVKAKSDDGYTALMFAVRQGNADVVAALVDKGADVDATNTNGMTPLTLAIYNSYWDIAGFLIDKGANVKADANGSTPLHLAIYIRTPDVESPFQAGAVRPPSTLTGMDIITALIARGADVNAQMTRPFPRIAGPKETSLAGATPFWLAAKGADATVMKLLVDAGADPNIATRQKTTPLMVAAGVGYSQAISFGTEAQALEAVKLAKELGNDINAQNAMGYTALHGAAIRGANSIVQYLADSGIRIDAKDRFGRTALTIAELGAGDSTQRRQLETAAYIQALMARK